MDDDAREPFLDDLADKVRREVAAGFTPLERIVDDCAECFEDEGEPDAIRAAARRLLDDAVAEQKRREAEWPAVTDNDRFDAAFARLESQGVVCRQDFSCCGTCAAAEIGDEIRAEQAKGREVVGCAHYHMQDTESAVDGGGLYLSYGSVLRGERPAIAVGEQIAAALRAEGLKVTWDGTLSRRIHVALDWKRRRRWPTP